MCEGVKVTSCLVLTEAAKQRGLARHLTVLGVEEFEVATSGGIWVAIRGISRYELGVHEPALPTARLIAHAMGAPLSYLYCEDDKVAALLLALHKLKLPRTGRFGSSWGSYRQTEPADRSAPPN